MNHAIHKPLFGKQESQESIQESYNQAKNSKIPESRRRNFRVADPSLFAQPYSQMHVQIKAFSNTSTRFNPYFGWCYHLYILYQPK